jgi:multidrug efflux pump subunit AcrA (membrane-fusion protein)
MAHETNSSRRRVRIIRSVITMTLVVLTAAYFEWSLSSGAAAQPGARAGESQPPARRGKALPSHQELLDRFVQLTPAARFELIGKITKADKELQTAVRSDLVSTVVERGSLQPSAASDIICRVKAKTTSRVATTIKWLVEDGTQVKKGDKVVELDDSDLQEAFQDRKITAEQTLDDKREAATDLDLQKKENRVTIRFHEIDLRLAELDLKKYAGNDPVEKEVLELRIERAALALGQAKARAKAAEAQAAARLRVRAALADLQATRLREIQEEIKACRLFAPQDGLAVYFVAESARGGFGRQDVVQVGENVREGQKLIQICDPDRWTVQTRVHESLISQVHRGQKATIRIDAFPGTTIAGRVQQIATVPAAQDFFSSDVKLYPVQVVPQDPKAGPKPGMSAEVTIEVARKTGVVQVPVKALLRSGRGYYCYVKVGQEIHKRQVVPGLRNDFAVEISSGLKESEPVVRDPRSLVRRLSRFLSRAAGSESRAPENGNKQIRVSSVLPPELLAGSRTRILTYGLTLKDMNCISALPNVGDVVPVRRVPQSVRHWQRVRNCLIVATTPQRANLADIHTAAGRFFAAEDLEQRKNVAVLGIDVADDLFPGDDAVGQVIVVGGHGYTVVGVLQDRPAETGITTEVVDSSIYLPLSTFQARFGERILLRLSGSLRGERVQLNDIWLTVPSEAVSATVENIRTVLEENHQKQDWSIEVDE